MISGILIFNLFIGNARVENGFHTLVKKSLDMTMNKLCRVAGGF
jgi:hypothetical protein